VSKRSEIEALRREGFVHLSAVENVLRDETSIVAEDDVAKLMLAIYKAAEIEAPQELVAEAEALDDE